MLIGVIIINSNVRVKVDGIDVVSNSRFRLQLLTDFVPNDRLFSLKKDYNVVMFEYSTEALELQLLRKVMTKIDKDFCKRFEEMAENIRHLDATVLERKEHVLEILLKSEEDVLEDKNLIVSLKGIRFLKNQELDLSFISFEFSRRYFDRKQTNVVYFSGRPNFFYKNFFEKM